MRAAVVNTPTLAYLAILNKDQSPGVYNKILGTIAGAQKNGFSGRIWCDTFSPGFLRRMSEMIINSKEKNLIIRSLCQYNFYLIYAFILARIQGKRIIIDVPTPNRVAIHEIANGNQGVLGKLKSLFYLTVFGPIPYWFTSGVLQYSNESAWFLLGNRSKTKLIGNGIEVSALPVRPKVPKWTGDRLDLICVASLNYWHGLDRLISAISIVNSCDQQLKIYLKIVGKGAVFDQLKSQVEELNLIKYVQFLGFLKGESLYSQYSTAHLGVGSLGLFRKKLNTASELKSREYCAVGIPFITVGEDPDFGKDAKFRIQLSNEESIMDLIQFFKNFKPEQINFSPSEIRAYAVQHLDFSVKIAQILK
ncbi:glycosyltransferase [Algoriphagus boritolerans]|uniref:Glycosyltransferase involved in cell wall bisynthesis n=1 Tax=Algoriphagus boritolerans DSM 17298 = JCM 18970 TaxID=1120964 RepID=A0A1H5RT33_9BACT|nr:glycosyltransferase [Algoriphagus boritolerans]SEF41492.1 Glycosyltransferase involved in cell wall bisynthesis [Algoriphagus boritolerans DSM 17298 = JCM 18970]